MQCVTPMFRFYNLNEPKSGRVVSRAQAMRELEADHNNIRKKIYEFNKLNRGWAYQLIPCKKCWACQLNYSAEWATRIMLEAKSYENNYFITLTYDDEHLPYAEKVTMPNGDIIENDGTWGGTLDENDVKRFINSIRQHFHRMGHDGIKYFYCGEYGETTHRPHYHMVLLNCPLDPMDFHDSHIDTNFKAHWKSKEIENYWGQGMVDVAELEWSCAAYVARYCTKKISFDSDKSEYYENGREPEFIRMSKGIGFEWYRKNKDELYKNDSLIMRTVKGNIGSVRPPKAFDRKLEESNPELLEKLKHSRSKAKERADKLKQSLSDYTDYENLIMSAEKVKQKMQMLPRVGEW